jgi:hypothetical protein
MSDNMTANQQRAMECVREAAQQGMALGAYARQRGFNERQIYDAVAALRRKGALPMPGPTRAPAKSDFMAVRIASPSVGVAASADSPVCDIRIGGTVIRCRQWPPAAWLATLGQAGLDAATPEH